MWSLFDEDKSQKIQRFPVESETEKFVYIRLEKIQNFSSNWKVKNFIGGFCTDRISKSGKKGLKKEAGKN